MDYELYIASGGRVTTDSRSIEPGAIFFALRGDNFDGNRYALAALRAGAAYAVVDDRALDGIDPRILLVDNTLQALQDLACSHRQALGLPIVALTGSNGKTTTKELIRSALSTKFEHIGCTEGNLNNHIGVPLTILTFTSSTQIGIVEMGANHQGEIAALCRIARPDVGLITNIGRAHLGGFGGVEGVRKGKGELFDYLTDTGGMAIFNQDDPTLRSLIADRPALAATPYSGNDGIGCELSLFGAYNELNAAAALGVATYFGADCAAAAAAIAAYCPADERIANRSQIIEHTRHNNRLIADSYNANPSSMEAAVSEFLALESPVKVLILGAMRELGEYSKIEHRRLVELASAATRCYFVGEEFRTLVDDGQLFATTEELSAELARRPITDSSILLKGSRSNRLETLIDKL